MISLGTTQKIQVVTSGDGGEQVDVLAAWVDTADDLPASAETNITSATTTDIVASPSSGLRQVDLLNIRNKDTASCDITVQQYNSSGTKTAQLIKVTLPAGFTLLFTPKAGWQIVNPSSNIGASFYATCGTAQSIGASGAKVAFATEQFDTHGWYDHTTGTGSDGYRFKPLRAGKYRFNAAILCASPSSGMVVNLQLQKNGSTSAGSCFNDRMTSPTTDYCQSSVTGVFSLNGSTDYVEAFAYHGETKSLYADGAYNFFCGEWVGD